MPNIISHQGNANPNHVTPIGMAIMKTKQKVTSIPKDLEKLKLCFADRKVKWSESMKNGRVVPQKIKNKTTICSSNSPLGLYPQGWQAGSSRDVCTSTSHSTIRSSQGRGNPSVH